MPIYIFVEVARRELEGRLLLALAAAERGHDVVLGKIPHGALKEGRLGQWRLPPGVLHLKSIVGSPRLYGRLDGFRSAGASVSVQDEEHGLAGPLDYDEFGRARLPADAVSRADSLMAWGEHDTAWLRTTHPSVHAVATGSPRLDLWRPEVIDGTVGERATVGRHLLFVSSITPFGTNPFWVTRAQARAGAFGSGYVGDDDPAEFAAYDGVGPAYLHVKDWVRAIRRVARRYPDVSVVVRPHHFEEPEVWPALIGDYPNVSYDTSSTSRELVASSAAVVQCGSSIALESRVAERPVLTFSPVEGPWDDWGSNQLGRRVTSIDQLVEAVDATLERGKNDRATDAEGDFLASRLTALDGPLAADRIVDEWERMMTPATSGRIERIVRRQSLRAFVGRPLRAVQGAVRRGPADVHSRRTDKGPYAMEVEHKFPSLDVDALRANAARLAAHLGRFQDVEIVQIGDREVLLRAAGR